jgi:RNA polymerase sigma-70 factor (TIGR02960 family)
MTDTRITARQGEEDAITAVVRTGASKQFAELAERHRRELRVHCYRMLGNLDDADDVVQDTMLRAWVNRAGFEGRSTFRAWLYRIATNACLDTIKQQHRRLPILNGLEQGPAYDQMPWLQPMPSTPLALGPEAAVINQETVELVVLASIQHLPPRQRAVLILRDLLGWTPAEIGEALADTTAAVNSLLQRARGRLSAVAHVDLRTRRRNSPPTPHERNLLDQYIEAHARGDAAAVIELLDENVRLTMPPYEARYDGLPAAANFFTGLLTPAAPGTWQLIASEANQQLAAINYRIQDGETTARAITVDVLRFHNGRIEQIVTFGPDAVHAFGLPPTLRRSTPRS